MSDEEKEFNTTIRDLMRQMEEMGITIADVSVYPSHSKTKEFLEAIIAAYFKDKACVFTISVSSAFNPYSIKFSIDGQFTESIPQEKIEKEFSDIERHATGSEDYRLTFEINHSPSGKSNEEIIAAGIGFFKDFIAKYGEFLQDKFTKDVFLWFVPEFSYELEKLKEKISEDEALDLINDRIKGKFPKGYLVAD